MDPLRQSQLQQRNAMFAYATEVHERVLRAAHPLQDLTPVAQVGHMVEVTEYLQRQFLNSPKPPAADPSHLVSMDISANSSPRSKLLLRLRPLPLSLSPLKPLPPLQTSTSVPADLIDFIDTATQTECNETNETNNLPSPLSEILSEQIDFSFVPTLSAVSLLSADSSAPDNTVSPAPDNDVPAEPPTIALASSPIAIPNAWLTPSPKIKEPLASSPRSSILTPTFPGSPTTTTLLPAPSPTKPSPIKPTPFPPHLAPNIRRSTRRRSQPLKGQGGCYLLRQDSRPSSRSRGVFGIIGTDPESVPDILTVTRIPDWQCWAGTEEP